MNETKISEIPGLCIHFVKDEDLTSEDIKSLWQQGVNMDDWDYMLLCPPDVVQEVKKRDGWDQSEYTEFDCKDWSLDGMLRGCSSNRWYRANLRGKEWALGIAYHA